LTELDISKDADIRVNAFADRITEKEFVIHTDAWSDTVLYSAGVTWTEVASTDGDVQVGEFNTLELRPWNDPKLQNAKRINFERAPSSSHRKSSSGSRASTWTRATTGVSQRMPQI